MKMLGSRTDADDVSDTTCAKWVIMKIPNCAINTAF